MPEWFPDSLEWWRFKDWLNVELVEELLARRKETSRKKNINSPLAITKLLKRLEKQYRERWPVNAMLNEAINGGWLWTFTSNHTQREKPRLSPGPLFDTVRPLVEKTKIPPRADPEKKRREVQAMLKLMEDGK